MQIEITGRHMTVTPEIREFAEQKASKLTRYFDRLTGIEVKLQAENGECVVEMIAGTEHKKDIVASVRNADLFSAIDLTVDKMERQLTKYKEKLQDHRREPRTSDQFPAEIEGDDDELEEYEDTEESITL